MATDVAPVRVGFVGLGGIARSRHLPGLRAIPGVCVTAVANSTRESGERAAREFGIPAVCDTWEDLVQRTDVDAVFIGTWPHLHCPVTLAALDMGKHVFCQARMARDYAEAQMMYDAARRSDRVTGLCPVPIGLSIDKTVARLQREGYLGAVRLVRVQSLGAAFAAPETPMTWRKDERLSGLNMHTLGMYAEVIHRWFGWTRSVEACTQIFTPERVTPGGEPRTVVVPDQVLFSAEMEVGFPVQYAISAAVHHGTDRIEVYGERATLVYEVNADRLYGARPGGSLEAVAIHEDDRYDVTNWRVERDVIDAIRLGTPYRPDFEDGLRYMGVVQAVYTSAAQQRRVEVP